MHNHEKRMLSVMVWCHGGNPLRRCTHTRHGVSTLHVLSKVWSIQVQTPIRSRGPSRHLDSHGATSWLHLTGLVSPSVTVRLCSIGAAEAEPIRDAAGQLATNMKRATLEPSCPSPWFERHLQLMHYHQPVIGATADKEQVGLHNRRSGGRWPTKPSWSCASEVMLWRSRLTAVTVHGEARQELHGPVWPSTSSLHVSHGERERALSANAIANSSHAESRMERWKRKRKDEVVE